MYLEVWTKSSNASWPVGQKMAKGIIIFQKIVACDYLQDDGVLLSWCHLLKNVSTEVWGVNAYKYTVYIPKYLILTAL